MRGISGVYTIEADGVFYVGATKNIRDRWADHMNRLLLGTHDNSAVQQVFDRHGLTAFTFRVLELCDRAELPSREQSWLDHYRKGGHTVHASPSARSTGCFAPGAMKGRPKSAEHKARIAAAQAAAWKRDDGTRKAALVERNQTTHPWRD
jgi:group I intron endonuclease